MYKLYIKKLFTGGLLKGLTYNDYITFSELEEANKWSMGTKVKRPYGNTSPYEIIDASFQSFQR